MSLKAALTCHEEVGGDEDKKHGPKQVGEGRHGVWLKQAGAGKNGARVCGHVECARITLDFAGAGRRDQWLNWAGADINNQAHADLYPFQCEMMLMPSLLRAFPVFIFNEDTQMTWLGTCVKSRVHYINMYMT